MLAPADLVRLVKPGPRYTSYPPATQFSTGVASAEARAELARCGATGEPVSLYIHVPFCPSLCWYCGCNVVISRDRGRAAAYVDSLIAELDVMAEALGARLPLTELSLGGGSPNFLPPEELTRLMDAVRARFDVADDAELGIELDPRETTPEQVRALADAGFTRVSVGVQDFSPQVQKAIHREQSFEQTKALVDEARACGFKTLNVDLVYGLPHQSAIPFGHTLDKVLELRPDRLALFGYAHLPHLRPHQKLVERGGPLPDTQARAELLWQARARLSRAGMVPLGIDHFARPEDSLVQAANRGEMHRNFQGYVVRRAPYLLGIGSTAISDTGRMYWQNTPALDAWEAAVGSGELPVARGVALDDDVVLRRHVITRLMCDNELSFDEVEAAFDITFEEYFAAELAELSTPEHAELIAIDYGERRMIATPAGRYLIRNVCMAFDRYLKDAMRSGAKFSQSL